MRLDRIVTEHLCALEDNNQYDAKRKKRAARLITGGSVFVDGVAVTNSKVQVIPNVQTVVVGDEQVIDPQAHHSFYKFNKPRGYICQRHPTDPNVYDLIPPELKLKHGNDLVSWGRLDRDTTGVLIFGTDGGISHLVLRPTTSSDSRVKWKTYIATLSAPTSELQADAAKKLKDGVVIPGTSTSHGDVNDPSPAERISCLPAHLRVVDEKRVELQIQEGFYHQVKRMMRFVGGEVAELHRCDFGGVELKGLKEGEFQELTREEILRLVPVGMMGYSSDFAVEIEKRRKVGRLD